MVDPLMYNLLFWEIIMFVSHSIMRREADGRNKDGKKGGKTKKEVCGWNIQKEYIYIYIINTREIGYSKQNSLKNVWILVKNHPQW